MSYSTIVVSETIGTAVLILLGTGVVANHQLRKTNGHGGGALFINIGWGFAVFTGASVADKSGAHLNPALTFALALTKKVTWDTVPFYFLGEMLGAVIGAVLCWAMYKMQFDHDPQPHNTLGIFATRPQIPHKFWNVVSEVIATFVLVAWVLFSPGAASDDGGVPVFGNSALGYAAVAFVVLVIGASLGGPTGYAINPARDLGPRLAYAFILPIKGKGSAEWGYAWIPVVGPMLGSTFAALLYLAIS